MNTIGVDVGRSHVKVWAPNKHFTFKSLLEEYRDLEFEDEKGADDLVIQFRGRKYIGGTLAEREGEYEGSLMTESKLHEDTVILTLTALHKALPSGKVGLVSGLPVKHHSKAKQRLKQLLDGYHAITVNGELKNFEIQSAIAPEGVGFFKYGKSLRGLNIGSRTVNAITFRNGQKIGKESDTFDFGMETMRSQKMSAMGKGIAAKIGALKWKAEDFIYLSGGGASSILPYLSQYYPNLHLTPNPIYTDAEAFCLTARELYG